MTSGKIKWLPTAGIREGDSPFLGVRQPSTEQMVKFTATTTTSDGHTFMADQARHKHQHDALHHKHVHHGGATKLGKLAQSSREHHSGPKVPNDEGVDEDRMFMAEPAGSPDPGSKFEQQAVEIPAMDHGWLQSYALRVLIAILHKYVLTETVERLWPTSVRKSVNRGNSAVLDQMLTSIVRGQLMRTNRRKIRRVSPQLST